MISDVYFPRVNGVSTSIRTFVHGLEQQGHEVTLIAPAYTDDDSAQDGIKGEVIRIPARRVPFDPEDRMMKRNEILRLLPDLKQRAFDVLHIHTPFVAHYAGVRLARELAIPVVETYHTHFEEYLHHYLRFVPRLWLQFVTRRFARSQGSQVDAMVVPSRLMRDLLQQYGLRVPLQILPTGLDDSFFEQGDGQVFKVKHNINPARPCLCHVGRAAFEKNIDFLIEMLAQVRNRVPDILLILAGEGPALKHLQQKVDSMNLDSHVRFIGYLDRETQLKDCYSAGDIFVFASRTETQGLVLLEAMAQAVPVVSTAMLGTVDILAPQQGAIIANEDVNDFADKVVLLLQDDAMRKNKRRQAIDYARGWSASEMAARLAELYTEVVSAQARMDALEQAGEA